MASETQIIGNQKSGGLLRKILVIMIPILIIIGFIVGTSVIIKLNKKPEEKKKAFNSLAVMADYAVLDDIQLGVSCLLYTSDAADE